MDLSKAMSITRNPYGFDCLTQREARLMVCDEVERLEKLSDRRLETIKSMSGYLDDVAVMLGIPKPGTPGEGVGACFKVIGAIQTIQTDILNLQAAWEVAMCEDHCNAPDLYAQHQAVGGGCLLCEVQLLKKEVSTLQTLVPHPGDGSCEKCGAAPATAVTLCEECRTATCGG